MNYFGKAHSPGKIAARAHAYASVHTSELKNKHIVIASRECGDIHYLLSIGVDASLIVACDIDDEAIRCAADLGVSVRPWSIENLIDAECEKDIHTVASINVDLFGGLSGAAMDAIITVCDALVRNNWKGSLFYTFNRQGRGERHLKLRSTEEKVEYLSKQLSKVGWHKSTKDILRDGYEYQSSSLSSKGTPMYMANLSVGDKTMKKISKKAQAKKWSDAGKKAWKTRRKNALKK